MRTGDELLHIFTHHLKRTEDDLREMLRDYMLANSEWMLDIAKSVLLEQDMTLEDYIDTVTTPGSPVDAVCILVLAKIFNMHVAIFLKKGVWCTSKDRSLKKCRLGLIFNGNGQFTETVKAGHSAKYIEFLKRHQQSGELLSHQRTKMPGIPPKFERTVPPEPEYDREDRPEMDIPSILTSTDKRHIPTVNNDIPTDLSTSSSSFGKDITGASSPKNGNAANIQDGNSSDSEASIVMGEYVPPPVMQRASGPQVCPACGNQEASQSKLIVHIATFHPSYAYPCRYCNKTFLSHTSRYKHEVDHTAPTHFCGICAKGFHSNAELSRHMPRHSGLRPFPCNTCTKAYYDKKSLNRHLELHNSKTYDCPTCGKAYESKESKRTAWKRVSSPMRPIF